MEVPDFQRNFSWNTSAVETFWQDVTTFSDLRATISPIKSTS